MEKVREFKAYTYYLYHVPTGKKYYGSRVANKCEPEKDLWNKYFSSSVLVEALIKEYGKTSFVPEIRKTFNTAQEARDWEDEVHHRLKIVEKEDWLNQAYMCGPFYTNWKGRKHKPESIVKMIVGNTGKPAWNKSLRWYLDANNNRVRVRIEDSLDIYILSSTAKIIAKVVIPRKKRSKNSSPRSEEYIRKQKESHKNQVPWIKGGKQSAEHVANRMESSKRTRALNKLNKGIS